MRRPATRYQKPAASSQPFWDEPGRAPAFRDQGGTNWSPMPYSPDTGYFYVPGSIRTSVFERFPRQYRRGQHLHRRLSGGGSPYVAHDGTFTAIDSTTNKIAWQHKTPYRMGGGSGSTVTAGGLLLRGDPTATFVVLDAKTGEVLWKFQTGFGADAPPVVYEVDGEQYIAIATGGNSIQRSATGDAVWAFSLKGKLGPSWWPPRPPSANTGPSFWWRIWGAVSPYGCPIRVPSISMSRAGPGARGDRGDR